MKNQFGFVESEAEEIRFYPNRDRYSVTSKLNGMQIAESFNSVEYAAFRRYCLQSPDLFPKCVDYVVEDNVFKSRIRWVDNARVQAEALPARPKDRESIWEAVRVGLYDHPKEVSVAIADRVSNALERDAPGIIVVGKTRYHREDRISVRFIEEAKELRERCAILIRGLRSVVDECEARLRPKAKMIHVGCGGLVIGDSDFIAGEDGGSETWWSYRCLKCSETFQDKKEFQQRPRPAKRKAQRKGSSK